MVNSLVWFESYYPNKWPSFDFCKHTKGA